MNLRSQALLAVFDAHDGRHFENLFDAEFGATVTSLLNGRIIHASDRPASGVFMVCRQIGGRRRDTGDVPARPVVRAASSRLKTGFVCEDCRLAEQTVAMEQAVRAGMAIHILARPEPARN